MDRSPTTLCVTCVLGGLLLGGSPCRAAFVIYDTALQAPWRDVDPGLYHDLNNTELGSPAMRVDFTANDQRFAFYPTPFDFPPANSGVPLQDHTVLSVELYVTDATKGYGLDRIQMFLGDGSPTRVEFDTGNAPLGWNPTVANTWVKYTIDLSTAIPGLNGTWTVDRLWLRNRFNDNETFWVRNLQFEAPASPVPAPPAAVLLAGGLLALACGRWRRRPDQAIQHN